MATLTGTVMFDPLMLSQCYNVLNFPYRFVGRAAGCLRVARHFCNRDLGVITNVYFDGFNFFYGCFKNNRDPATATARTYKWANLRRLSELLVPNDRVHRMHYCTARIMGTTSDPNKPLRQDALLRALSTLPQFYIHYGSHQPRQKRGMLLDSRMQPTGQLRTVEVWEEKGSDVNLATYLLMDAFLGDFEKAVIVSNDSDLAEPIRIVRTRLHLDIEVISPYPSVNTALRSAASSHRVLDKSLLAQCQFPRTLYDRKGKLVHKPSQW